MNSVTFMKTSEEDDVEVDEEDRFFFGDNSFTDWSLAAAPPIGVDTTFFGEDNGLWPLCFARTMLTPILGGSLLPLAVRDLSKGKLQALSWVFTHL